MAGMGFFVLHVPAPNGVDAAAVISLTVMLPVQGPVEGRRVAVTVHEAQNAGAGLLLGAIVRKRRRAGAVVPHTFVRRHLQSEESFLGIAMRRK